jgi:hypothetical protein
MNRRLYLILLPVFVLLFSVHGKAGIDGWHSHVASGSWFAHKHSGNTIKTGDNRAVWKHDQKEFKNKIRLKAWDEAAIAVLALRYCPQPVFYYSTRSWQHHYEFLHSSWSSRFQSRGPPAVI